MEIIILEKEIDLEELVRLAEKSFGNMVKAVVDINKEIMALGGDLHADEESLLLEHGSNQGDLWGINLYTDRENIIEFDSMINLRPSQGNKSRGVEDPKTRDIIINVVNKLVKK